MEAGAVTAAVAAPPLPGASPGVPVMVIDKDTGRVFSVAEIDYDAFTTFDKDAFLGIKVCGTERVQHVFAVRGARAGVVSGVRAC